MSYELSESLRASLIGPDFKHNNNSISAELAAELAEMEPYAPAVMAGMGADQAIALLSQGHSSITNKQAPFIGGGQAAHPQQYAVR